MAITNCILWRTQQKIQVQKKNSLEETYIFSWKRKNIVSFSSKFSVLLSFYLSRKRLQDVSVALFSFKYHFLNLRETRHCLMKIKLHTLRISAVAGKHFAKFQKFLYKNKNYIVHLITCIPSISFNFLYFYFFLIPKHQHLRYSSIMYICNFSYITIFSYYIFRYLSYCSRMFFYTSRFLFSISHTYSTFHFPLLFSYTIHSSCYFDFQDVCLRSTLNPPTLLNLLIFSSIFPPPPDIQIESLKCPLFRFNISILSLSEIPTNILADSRQNIQFPL